MFKYYYFLGKIKCNCREEGVNWALNKYQNICRDDIFVDEPIKAKTSEKKRSVYFCIETGIESSLKEISKRIKEALGISEIEDKRLRRVLRGNINCKESKINVIGFDTVYPNTKYKKILYLGTHITSKSLDAQMFYKDIHNNSLINLTGNDFWPTISYTYGCDFGDSIEIITKKLHEHNIAIADIIGECEFFDSRDGSIIDGTQKKNKYLQALIDEADVIVFNGANTERMLDDLVRTFPKEFDYKIDKRKIRIIKMISTSGQAWKLDGHKFDSVEAKRNYWKNNIGIFSEE